MNRTKAHWLSIEYRPWGIPTQRRGIRDYMNMEEWSIVSLTVFCIAVGKEDPRFDLALYAVCSKLHFLSRLWWKSGKQWVKLSAERYDMELFEGKAETQEEVADILKCLPGLTLTSEMARSVFHQLKIIRQLWYHMIASTREQVFLSELAFALEYVLDRHGDLPDPQFRCEGDLFPCNYEDFHCGGHPFSHLEHGEMDCLAQSGS